MPEPVKPLIPPCNDSLLCSHFSDMNVQAVSAAAVQFLKLLGALLIVRRGLKPYKPLPPNW